MAISKELTNVGLGKYKTIAISTAVFTFLILALLGLNLFISNILEQNTRTINAASNQVSLVEQISKELFIINSEYQKVLPYQDDKARLKVIMDNFDTNLAAFTTGGALAEMDDNNKPIRIDRLEGSDIQGLLQQAQTIWSGYRRDVYQLFSNDQNTLGELLTALAYTSTNNEKLTDVMSSITDVVQQQGEQSLGTLRIIQFVGIALAVFSFVIIVFYFVRQLRTSDLELEQAQEETTGILNTVREGLFLLDEDLSISSQYSNEMEEIFESKDIAGSEFSGLLKKIVSTKEIDSVEDFVKLLFDPHVIEELMVNLNPLGEIKVNIMREDGNYVRKFLDFNFYRVLSRGEIRSVLVSVRDVTDQVLLKEQLANTQAESDDRIELLDLFLHADQKLARSFLKDGRVALDSINDILKEPLTGKVELKRKVDKMFVEMHRLKGEAAALKFDSFAEKAHEFENELQSLKEVNDIEGLDFLPLTIRLDKMISFTQALESLASRLPETFSLTGTNELAAPADVMDVRTLAKQWEHIPDMVDKIAGEYDKKVDLVMSGFSENQLGDSYQSFVNDISIQLIRNALVHGIENQEERLKKLKKANGRIDLRLSKLPDGSLELAVRDDGRGFNYEGIRNKLLEKGMASEAEINSLSKNKLLRMAFKTGFSTAEEVDMNAGRGVGLDVIRQSTTKMGGKVTLRQIEDRYCQFEIVLPPEEGAQAA